MIPELLQNMTGRPFGKTTFQIERESVRRFAEAVGDLNPLYIDGGYASLSKHGSLITPPGFLSSPWYWGDKEENDEKEISGLGDIIRLLIDAGYPQTFDSGIDYEFLRPVRVGDIITAESSIIEIVERGKGDEKALFLFTETVYTNQIGKTVCISRVTTTHR